MLEACFRSAGAKNLSEFVQANLFANIALERHQKGSTQRRLRRLSLRGQCLSQVVRDDRGPCCKFLRHSQDFRSGGATDKPPGRSDEISIVPESGKYGEGHALYGAGSCPASN